MLICSSEREDIRSRKEIFLTKEIICKLSISDVICGGSLGDTVLMQLIDPQGNFKYKHFSQNYTNIE